MYQKKVKFFTQRLEKKGYLQGKGKLTSRCGEILISNTTIDKTQ